ncbi:DUF4189 domain-containing protein [Stenotrophomonas cyclobalanopsidis]|uniref:DUF4189 domain-containing protein n=1 Tax=Stenotrophomonas cyclobalanopsidis TaxID=2771362 RepID=UPI00345FCFA0
MVSAIPGRPSLKSGGAWASGTGGVFTWTSTADSEEEARKSAFEQCLATGAGDCEVDMTFVTACAAVARGPVRNRYAISPEGVRSVSRLALKTCGSKCEIVFAGCALP